MRLRLLASLSLLALAACGPDAPDHTLALDRLTPAPTVVSLLPAATEILLALEAGDRLVGRSEADGNREGVGQLPSVGAVLAPELERLRTLAPSLVVVWSDLPELPRVREVVEGYGGRVIPLALDRVEDIPPAIRLLAQELGRGEKGQEVAQAFLAELRGVERLVAGFGDRPSPRVAWVVSPTPPYLAGPGTFLHDLLQLAGAVNVVPASEGPWATVGMEWLAAAELDALVWPAPDPEAPIPEPWSRLEVVRQGRVIRVDPVRVEVPGPGLPSVARELALRFHTDPGGPP